MKSPTHDSALSKVNDEQDFKLKDLKVNAEGLEMTLDEPDVAKRLAAGLVQSFIENGATNFIEMSISHRDHGAFTVLVQKQGGLTPAQKLGNLERSLLDQPQGLDENLILGNVEKTPNIPSAENVISDSEIWNLGARIYPDHTERMAWCNGYRAALERVKNGS